MSVILLLIPLSIVIAAGFLAAFIWAVRSGQYEDTCTPSMRLLVEEESTTGKCATTSRASVKPSIGRGESNPKSARLSESFGEGTAKDA